MLLKASSCLWSHGGQPKTLVSSAGRLLLPWGGEMCSSESLRYTCHSPPGSEGRVFFFFIVPVSQQTKVTASSLSGLWFLSAMARSFGYLLSLQLCSASSTCLLISSLEISLLKLTITEDRNRSKVLCFIEIPYSSAPHTATFLKLKVAGQANLRYRSNIV